MTETLLIGSIIALLEVVVLFGVNRVLKRVGEFELVMDVFEAARDGEISPEEFVAFLDKYEVKDKVKALLLD